MSARFARAARSPRSHILLLLYVIVDDPARRRLACSTYYYYNIRHLLYVCTYIYYVCGQRRVQLYPRAGERSRYYFVVVVVVVVVIPADTNAGAQLTDGPPDDDWLRSNPSKKKKKRKKLCTHTHWRAHKYNIHILCAYSGEKNKYEKGLKPSAGSTMKYIIYTEHVLLLLYYIVCVITYISTHDNIVYVSLVVCCTVYIYFPEKPFGVLHRMCRYYRCTE